MMEKYLVTVSKFEYERLKEIEDKYYNIIYLLNSLAAQACMDDPDGVRRALRAKKEARKAANDG